MLAIVQSVALYGLEGQPVQVEVDVSPGLPGWEIVGLPDPSVREAKDRVRTAIRNSGLGLNPAAEGVVIRVPLPELNEERRRDLTKVAHNYAEQARVAVRHIRRDGMDLLKKLEKDGTLSQDDSRKFGDQVQVATDAAVADIDKVVATKEQEIMQV